MRDCVPEEPTVHVEYPGDLQGTKVTYLNGDTEELLVTPVAADLFLLEESSLLGHDLTLVLESPKVMFGDEPVP